MKVHVQKQFLILHQDVLSSVWPYWQVYLQCENYMYNTDTKIIVAVGRTVILSVKIVRKLLSGINCKTFLLVVEIMKLGAFIICHSVI